MILQPLPKRNLVRFLSFLALLLCVGLMPQAQAKQGGGFQLDFSGKAGGGGLMGFGGEGVIYPGPRLRMGAEFSLLTSQVGPGARGGLFLDFVPSHIANADIFFGAGLGIGGGSAFNGASLYVRPELGVQWNLGMMAFATKLHASFAAPLVPDEQPGTYVGLSLSLLFGRFPVAGMGHGHGHPHGGPYTPHRRGRRPPPPARPR